MVSFSYFILIARPTPPFLPRASRLALAFAPVLPSTSFDPSQPLRFQSPRVFGSGRWGPATLLVRRDECESSLLQRARCVLRG